MSTTRLLARLKSLSEESKRSIWGESLTVHELTTNFGYYHKLLLDDANELEKCIQHCSDAVLVVLVESNINMKNETGKTREAYEKILRDLYQVSINNSPCGVYVILV